MSFQDARDEYFQDVEQNKVYSTKHGLENLLFTKIMVYVVFRI